VVWDGLVDALADGVNQFSGTFAGFHDGVGGVRAAVGGACHEGDGLDFRPTLVGDDQGFVAVLGGERVAENHDVHPWFGGQLLDVGEAGRGANVEAGLLEDEAAGVNELVIAAKDKHGSGDRHRGRPGC
jgi:hypothetical protein